MGKPGRLREYALSWICAGAVSMSCGGQASKPSGAHAEGATGATSSLPSGDTGSSAASSGTASVGSQSANGTGGDAGTARGGAGSAGRPNGSSLGGSAGVSVASSSGANDGVSGSGFGVAGAGLDGDGGRAGSANDGDDGGASAAGGDDAGGAANVPGTAAGAIAMWVDPLGDQSRACKVDGIGYRIADTLDNQLTTNGTDGVAVSCKLLLNGGDYDFSGTIAGSATAMSDAISYNGDPPTYQAALSFSFHSQGSRADDPLPVTLSFFSSDTGTLTPPNDAPTRSDCTMHIVYMDAGESMSMITCPIVENPGDDATGCALQGTFVFRYCDTGE